MSVDDVAGSEEPEGRAYEEEEEQATYFLRPKSPESTRDDSIERDDHPFQPDDDPVFAAFDRSVEDSFGREESRTESLDDSGVRGQSYDYSEEDRIVEVLEQQQELRRRKVLIPPKPYLGGIVEEVEEEAVEVEQGGVGRTLGGWLRPVWSTLNRPGLDWSKVVKALGVVLLASALLSALL
jgi:hypothetical protein